MKIKSYFIILFFCFISTNAMSLPRCENLYNAIYNENVKYDVGINTKENQKTIGIRLDKYWNEKKIIVLSSGKEYEYPGWELKKNKDGYFMVGKITMGNLSSQIKSGDIVLSINDIDLREVSKNKKKLKILNKDVSDLFKADELIKFKLLRNGKVIEVDRTYKKSEKPNIKNELRSFDSPAIDFFINSIEINEKDGSFDASIETNFLERIDDRYFLTHAIWEHIVADKEFDEEKLVNFYWEQCTFSDERWQKLNSEDPAFGLRFANVIKEYRQNRSSEYLVKPKYSYFDFYDTGGYLQDKASVEYNSTSVYKIKNEFNLKTFPFDRQKLKIFLYNEKHDINDFRALVTSYSMKRALQFKENNSIQGWDINGVEMHYEFHNDPNSFKYHDGISINLDIERKSRYYIVKIILPIILILAVCWSAVWIDPREIESRLTITIVCLLSLIAYNFVIDSELPKLEYLTIMDYIILISYVYATIPNFLSVISFNLIKKNKLLAEKYESYEKKLGLPSYLLIILLIIVINSNSNPEHTSSMLSWIASK